MIKREYLDEELLSKKILNAQIKQKEAKKKLQRLEFEDFRRTRNGKSSKK